MASQILSQIEEKIEYLSHKEKLRLIKELTHRLKEDPIRKGKVEESSFKNQLAAMAKDPEIQAELRKINSEFTLTEADGLENK